jgi:hypothetical protein
MKISGSNFVHSFQAITVFRASQNLPLARHRRPPQRFVRPF